MGSKAPTFASETKTWSFVKPLGEAVVLMCQAQAFPVPLIRCDGNSALSKIIIIEVNGFKSSQSNRYSIKDHLVCICVDKLHILVS